MRQATNDIILAAGLLTRLPLPAWELDASRTSDAAWAWPLIGALLGGIGAVTGVCASVLGLPPLVAACLALIAMTLTTGGLHEDGLADTFDGLWGGRDPARRLEIMRDSRVGAYGVLALGLMLLLRVAVIAALAESGAWWVLVGAGALSRSTMAAMMTALPPARVDGLSQSTGRPSSKVAVIAAALAGAVSVLTGVPFVSWAAALIILLWLGFQAKSKLGGQTGDILGAGCLLSETAALMAAI